MAAQSRPELAVLYSHGNAGNLSHRGPGLSAGCRHSCVSVLIYDYPGFGKSTGGARRRLLRRGRGWLELGSRTSQNLQPRDIVLVGASLGGAMASIWPNVRIAEALVLIKAFSSIPDMASHR